VSLALWRKARLFFADMPKAAVGRPDGTRNRPAIDAAAERALRNTISRRP
jgi:hypothetical protein